MASTMSAGVRGRRVNAADSRSRSNIVPSGACRSVMPSVKNTHRSPRVQAVLHARHVAQLLPQQAHRRVEATLCASSPLAPLSGKRMTGRRHAQRARAGIEHARTPPSHTSACPTETGSAG